MCPPLEHFPFLLDVVADQCSLLCLQLKSSQLLGSLQTRLDENLPSSQSYILTLADAAHITPHIYTIGSILRTVVCQADLTEYVSLKKKFRNYF